MAIALVAWAQADAWAWRAGSGGEWLRRMALAPVPILVCIPFLYPPALLSASKHPWPLLDRHAQAMRTSDVLVSAYPTGHAVCWCSGRHDVMIAGAASEFDNELGDPADAARLLDADALAERVRAARRSSPGRSACVVLSTAAADALLAAPGVPPADERETDRDLTVLLWK